MVAAANEVRANEMADEAGIPRITFRRWRRARFSSIRLWRVRNPLSTAPSQSRNRSNMATKL